MEHIIIFTIYAVIVGFGLLVASDIAINGLRDRQANTIATETTDNSEETIVSENAEVTIAPSFEFDRLHDRRVCHTVTPKLDKPNFRKGMTVKAMQQWAKQHDIEIPRSCRRKQQIIEHLEAA